MRVNSGSGSASRVSWWRNAVIYEIYLRSFADGNGDGIGDIPGLRSRLPYLRDLGVDGILITPWYPSPMKDGGYDVSSYVGIEPLFGGPDLGAPLSVNPRSWVLISVKCWPGSGSGLPRAAAVGADRTPMICVGWPGQCNGLVSLPLRPSKSARPGQSIPSMLSNDRFSSMRTTTCLISMAATHSPRCSGTRTPPHHPPEPWWRWDFVRPQLRRLGDPGGSMDSGDPGRKPVRSDPVRTEVPDRSHRGVCLDRKDRHPYQNQMTQPMEPNPVSGL